MTDFKIIRNSLENIRAAAAALNCSALDDEYSDIMDECDNIENELDDFEPHEQDEITALVPEKMSAGEADSLKEAIMNWRTEHGYSNS